MRKPMNSQQAALINEVIIEMDAWIEGVQQNIATIHDEQTLQEIDYGEIGRLLYSIQSWVNCWGFTRSTNISHLARTMRLIVATGRDLVFRSPSCTELFLRSLTEIQQQFPRIAYGQDEEKERLAELCASYDTFIVDDPDGTWGRKFRGSAPQKRRESYVSVVFIFSGTFSDREDAYAYTQTSSPLRREKPRCAKGAVKEEEQHAIWPLQRDLGILLNPKFVKTLTGDGRYDYLKSISVDVNSVKTKCDADHNTLCCIFVEALEDVKHEPQRSTPRLSFCGWYQCGFDSQDHFAQQFTSYG